MFFCGGRITVQLCGGKVRKPTRYWTNNDYDRDNNTKNEGGGRKRLANLVHRQTQHKKWRLTKIVLLFLLWIHHQHTQSDNQTTDSPLSPLSPLFLFTSLCTPPISTRNQTATPQHIAEYRVQSQQSKAKKHPNNDNDGRTKLRQRRN